MAPLLVLALLSAASMAANYQGQKKVDKSRADALDEESRRRKAAEARSSEAARSTSELFTSAAKDQGGKAAEIEAQYAAHAPTPGAGPSTSTLAGFTAPPRSTLTVGSDTRALERSRAETAGVAKAKANLGAYGELMGERAILADRNQQDIDRENTGVRNWNQYVLPAKLAKANLAGQDWGTLADALQIASAIYGPIGLSKGAGRGLNAAYDVSTTAPSQGGIQSALRYV